MAVFPETVLVYEVGGFTGRGAGAVLAWVTSNHVATARVRHGPCVTVNELRTSVGFNVNVEQVDVTEVFIEEAQPCRRPRGEICTLKP